MPTIELTEDALKEYIDKNIMFWREKSMSCGYNSKIAVYYIDAFQSIRISLLGKLLPNDNINTHIM